MLKDITIPRLSEPLALLQRPVGSIDLSSLYRIHPETRISYEGGLVVFTSLPADILQVFKSTVLRAPTTKDRRLAGSKALRRVLSDDVPFGFKPSRPVFGHSAGALRYTVDYPKDYEVMKNLGEVLDLIAVTTIGQEFLEQHQNAKEQINPNYLIGNTSFTQGVINRSNALAYHFDRGNFPNSYSVMLWVVEDGIEGGELILPSLGAYITPIDGGVFIFKGQNIIHGVAKIIKKKPGIERMSVVFYTIEAMAKASSQEEEFRKSKEREFRKHFK